MKAKLSLMALALATSLGTFGCTEEPPSVTIKTVSAPSDCSAGGEQFITRGMYDPDVIHEGDDSPGYIMFLNLSNTMPNDSAWSNSGSSSSGGSTFEPEILARNTVIIDGVIFSCIEINGSEDGCKGKKPIVKKTGSVSIEAGQNALYSVRFLESDATDWGSFETVLIDIQLSFHDTGIWSGKSSHIMFYVIRGEAGYFDKIVNDRCKPLTHKETTGCAIRGQDDPMDDGTWSCDTDVSKSGGSGGDDEEEEEEEEEEEDEE